MTYRRIYMKAYKPFHDEENGKDRVKGEIFVIGEDKQDALEKQRLAFRCYCVSPSDEAEIRGWVGEWPADASV